MSIESPIGSGAPVGSGNSASTGTTGVTGTSSSGDTGVKQAAEQAKEQTKAVAGEAKQHMTAMVDQTRGELRQQVQQRSQQLSTSLEGLAGQLRSLRSGRPEEAGSLHHYLVDAEQKLSTWSQRLQQGGPDMLLRDVRSFARRKPGTFLAAALGAGFVAGRAVRVGVAAAHDQDSQDGRRSFQGGTSDASVGSSPNAYPNTSQTGSITDPAYGSTIPPAIDPALPASGSEAFA